MGVQPEELKNPDETYVLTADNLIKILAIHMKLRLYTICLLLYCNNNMRQLQIYRCNIPVVIMGETGCGKTRLVRYMCAIAAQKKPKMPEAEEREQKNFYVIKV